ncbi:EpsG family protein [Taibaiella lutea]|uniref:EpsG family protein n=1 Tax=Taibaiella lutea TaxID=2608001 RepID=UPI00167FE19F|nr:EpsG family protein [Taibaiella lutea]
MSFFAIIEVNIQEYFKKKTVDIFFIPITWLLIVGMMALRWDMGTDWKPYLSFFERFANWEEFYNGPPIFEKGFWLLNIFAKNIYNNYTFLLFIIEGTFFTLLFRFFKFSTPYVLLCILLYFGLNIGITGSHRQLLALVICLSGLKSLIEGNKLKFIGLVILAFFFHASALLFLIFLFLNISIPIAIIITVIGACFIIGQTKLPFVIFSSLAGISEHNAEKVDAYIKSAESELSRAQVSTMGIVKKILLPSIFLLTRKKIVEKYKYYNYFLNGYLFGVAFYFLFFKSLLVMVSRGSLYFNSMEPILLSLQLSIIKDKKIKNIVLFALCLFAIVFFFQSIKSYPDLFIPYKSVFEKE